MKKTEYYSIIHSTNNVFRIFSAEGVGMDLFVGTKKALLLDTGMGFGDLRGFVESITKLPLIVVNTHGHYDHANGNYQFADCPIYLNTNDSEAYNFYGKPQNRQAIIDSSKAKKAGWDSDEIINILPEDFDEQAYMHAPVAETRSLLEGMVFDLGGMTLKVFEVPGHTKGSCALLHEETGKIYLGDAANSHVVLCIFAAPVSEYINTLNKLIQLPFSEMIMSHENEPVKKKALYDYLDCITNPDPNNYIKASSPARPNESDYMYFRHGYAPSDVQKPGFASFIVKEKI